jgi:hypothetical protein
MIAGESRSGKHRRQHTSFCGSPGVSFSRAVRRRCAVDTSVGPRESADWRPACCAVLDLSTTFRAYVCYEAFFHDDVTFAFGPILVAFYPCFLQWSSFPENRVMTNSAHVDPTSPDSGECVYHWCHQRVPTGRVNAVLVSKSVTSPSAPNISAFLAVAEGWSRLLCLGCRTLGIRSSSAQIIFRVP